MAIYTEYQKDVPDMSRITFSSLNMDSKVFNIAVDKLENEGLITGAEINTPVDSQYPASVRLTSVKTTCKGIKYYEVLMNNPRDCPLCLYDKNVNEFKGDNIYA